MNITQQTIDSIKALGYTLHFQDEFINVVEPEKAIEMYIGYLKMGELIQYIGKTIKATKKETTVEYVMDKINAEKIYKNFSSEFNKAIREFGLNAYPTSYGIGVSVLFTSQSKESELTKVVEDALNKIGVAFKTEYSEAWWVFRFKISKSAENIQLLSNYKA